MRWWVPRFALPMALLVGLLLPSSAHAEDDDEERAFRIGYNKRYSIEFRERVRDAIKAGAKHLASRQLENGSWPSRYNGEYPMGPTALCVLTMLKCGTKPDHPRIEKAFEYLRKLPFEKVYSVGVLLMALDARYSPAHDPFEVTSERDKRYAHGGKRKKLPCESNIPKKDLKWMRRAVTYLVKQQNGEGTWRYPQGGYDLSNTQYALLGLKAAIRCGIKIPERTWLDSLRRLLELQEKDGEEIAYKANEIKGDYRIQWTEKANARGFRYVPNHPMVTGSMTTAGLAGLIICQSALWKSRRFKGKLRAATRLAIRDGMAWMQRWMTCTGNPVEGQGAMPANHYYYLYGLERAGILGRIRHFGDIDWYEDGAEVLIADQQRAARGGKPGGWPGDVVTSCFALLFLKRATWRMDVPVITPSGDTRVQRKPKAPATRRPDGRVR